MNPFVNKKLAINAIVMLAVIIFNKDIQALIPFNISTTTLIIIALIAVNFRMISLFIKSKINEGRN